MAGCKGSFQSASAIDFGAIPGREAIRRSCADPADFERAVLGSVLHTSADAIHGAWYIGLKAGHMIENPLPP
jgi:acetyl-CoA acetyltransferase